MEDSHQKLYNIKISEYIYIINYKTVFIIFHWHIGKKVLINDKLLISYIIINLNHISIKNDKYVLYLIEIKIISYSNYKLLILNIKLFSYSCRMLFVKLINTIILAILIKITFLILTNNVNYME